MLALRVKKLSLMRQTRAKLGHALGRRSRCDTVQSFGALVAGATGRVSSTSTTSAWVKAFAG